MRAVFVTGTDTGVGKSVVCGLLARYAREKGLSVITQKWIQTGSLGFSCDVKLHLKIMRRPRSEIKQYLDAASPYNFSAPLSPHKASSLENKIIRPEKIKKSFRLLAKVFDLVIVEGVGGLLVPYDKHNLVIDIARDLDLAVLLVSQNKLGVINHTLLTLQALAVRKLKCLGIVFNNARKEKRIILQDNPRIIRQLSRQKVFGVLPWEPDFDKLYKKFRPIGMSILAKIKSQRHKIQVISLAH
jgi:dethiobiotin synthetase